jgi:hypothetical protein
MREATTFTGGPIDLTTGFAGDQSLLIAFNNSEVVLNPDFMPLTWFYTFSPETTLAMPFKGSTSDSVFHTTGEFHLGKFTIVNEMEELPAINTPYPIALNSKASAAYVSTPENEEFNITTVFNPEAMDLGTTSIVFNPTSCHSRVIASHVINGTCISSRRWSCGSSWVGNYCECNTTGLVGILHCTSEGAVWTSNATTDLSDHVTLPSGHDLTINGDAHISSGISASSGSRLNVTGQLTLSSRLELSMKLIEKRIIGGCIVSSDLTLTAGSLTVSSGSEIDLKLDISSLSLDGSCVSPSGWTLDLSENSIINVAGDTSIASSGVVWSVSLITSAGQSLSFAQLSFTTGLIRFGSAISSTSNLVGSIHFSSGSSSNCGRVVVSPTSLVIGLDVGHCPTPPASSTPTSSASALSSDLARLILLLLIGPFLI